MRAQRIVQRNTLKKKVSAMKKMQVYFIQLGKVSENLRITTAAHGLEYGEGYEVASVDQQADTISHL